MRFFPLCFKMARGFENLDNILHNGVKDTVQKPCLVQTFRYENQGEQRKKNVSVRK